jgi:hypothetical protein
MTEWYAFEIHEAKVLNLKCEDARFPRMEWREKNEMGIKIEIKSRKCYVESGHSKNFLRSS